MLSLLFRGSPKVVLFRAALIISAIAFADWRIDGNVPLGFLYLIPMLLAGSVLNKWQVAGVAGLCTFLAEAFDGFQWETGGIPRDILVFAAFFCAGLFVCEVTRSRHLALQHLKVIEDESQARREAEEQLQVLVESSPAAILTADSNGGVLLANDAAHRLFGLTPGALAGRSIRQYLPALVPALARNRQSFRTVMQCRGKREDGEAFLADVWFSTYRTSAGPRLAAMVVDSSEDLRNREEIGLHQILAGSRILVGAVSHEVRNVCGAIAVIHQNLARSGALDRNKDFEALGTLITALEKIAAMDLRQMANQAASVDLASLLEEFRIVVEPSLRDSGITTYWTIDPDLPAVWADRQSLMQVFLNLVKNSERAMLKQPPPRELRVTACAENQHVEVRFRDNGGGVPNPDRLFRPFQPGAQTTGLGLYLSRAFMRSFRGDVRYQPEPGGDNFPGGANFIVELAPASAGGKQTYEPGHPDSTAGRPQPFPGEPQPVA